MPNEVDPKVWEEKDLRIAKQNALRHATLLVSSGCLDIGDCGVVNIVIKTARELVDYMYEKEVKTVDKVDMLAPLSEEDKVLKELSGQLKLTYQKEIDETKMCQLIMSKFGKYPSKLESVPRVLQAVDFDSCVI